MKSTTRKEKYIDETMLKIIKDNNKSLKRIESKLDDDPLINIFSKNKDRKKALLKFVLSLIIMIFVLIISCLFIYKDKILIDRIFDILGNGVYWIISGYIYLYVSHYIDKAMNRSVIYGKRKKY